MHIHESICKSTKHYTKRQKTKAENKSNTEAHTPSVHYYLLGILKIVIQN